MIFYTTNILALPLLILIWSIDMYMLTASLRLILSQLSATRMSTACRTLREIVDPIPNRVGAWLDTWRHRSSPAWIRWVIVIGIAVIARQVLTVFLVSICQS